MKDRISIPPFVQKHPTTGPFFQPAEQIFFPGAIDHVIQKEDNTVPDAPTSTPAPVTDAPPTANNTDAISGTGGNPVAPPSLPPPPSPPPFTPPAGGSNIDWFAIGQPYVSRGIPQLRLGPNSGVEQQWTIGYNFGRTLGLTPDRSAWLSNQLTPTAIDFSLANDYPTRWELMNREMNVSPIMLPIPALHFKLEVNQPGDAAEQEADAVAEKVASGEKAFKPSTIFFKAAAQPVQRAAANTGANAEITSQVTGVLQQLGQSMPDRLQSEMESSFGHDFSQVKIHTDANAAEASRSLQAKAFTTGNDIVFAEGQYSPQTKEGKKLLAHELTHVVQQQKTNTNQTLHGHSQNGLPVQKKEVPPVQPTEDFARVKMSNKYGSYFVRDDIEWHVAPLGFFLDLIVIFSEETAKKYSNQEVAFMCTTTFANNTGAKFKEGKEVELASKIYTALEQRKKPHTYPNVFFLEFWEHEVTNTLDNDAWLSYTQELRTAIGNPLSIGGALVASANFETDGKAEGPETKTTKVRASEPEWVKAKKKALDQRIAQAKQENGGSLLLPDDVVPWFNEKANQWYLNVWVKLDKQGKQKASQAISLKEKESDDALFEKVKTAAGKALLKAEDQERQQKAKTAPEWARTIEKEVKRRLDEEHKKNKSATDFPDGIGLSVEENKAAPNTPDRIYLQAWVERGKREIERNYGSVPINEYAKPEDIVPYIRRMSAVMRQFENTPLQDRKAPEDVVVNFTDTSMALSAFPAQLVPQDLRPDDITVTGAHNEFVLQLDYEAVYGNAGAMTDLYIASKLYNQYHRYYFELYRVPDGLQPPKGTNTANWPAKWNWLYLTYNPDDKEAQAAAPAKKPQMPQEPTAKPAPKVPDPGPRLFSTDGSEARQRIRFTDEPGDFLVKAYTGHAPIGEHKLKRMSSVRWYPVRTKPLKDEATKAVTKRTGKIATVEQEIKDLEKAKAGSENLSDKDKKILEGNLKAKGEELARLQAAETGTLPDSTNAEISFIDKTLKQIAELDALLPQIIEKAKAQNTPPSDLIERGDLLTLYWYILNNNKTTKGYQDELTAYRKHLQGVLSRAENFKNKFDPSSPYVYNIEAVFVSTVTGMVYPLTMIIGEVPVQNQRDERYMGGLKRFYNLVDVTHPETAKTYSGISFQSGPEGHKEAINNAFEDFGDEAVYGEGKIAVRFPPGKVGTADPAHPGTEVKFYNSKEGILQKVLKILAIVALVAGLAALAATGIGAPAAALALGAVAGVAGAITSIKNISDRSRRNKLEWDAEMALDIISIISIIPLTAGTRLATLPRAIAGSQKFLVTRRLLQIYSWTEMGATVYLVPTKMAEDIKRIQSDPDLTDDQKKRMIEEAQHGAIQAGIMVLGGAVASRVGHFNEKATGFAHDEDFAALQRQAELVELEWHDQYQSMADRGWVKENGQWTEKAPDIVREKSPLPEAPVTTPPKEPSVETPVKPVEPETPKPAVPEKPPVPETAPKPEAEPTPKPKPEPEPKPTEPEPKPVEPETKPKPEAEPAPKNETEGPKPAPEQKPPATETVQDKNIREAEEATKKAAGERADLEKELDKATKELAEAKKKLTGTKGDERKAAKDAIERAKAEKKTYEQLVELARHDEVRASFKASGLRQEKLSANVEAARVPEREVEGAINSRENQKSRNNERIRNKLSERDKLRDKLRSEDPSRTRSQQQDDQNKVAQLESEMAEINERQNTLDAEIQEQRRKLADLRMKTYKQIELLEAERRAAVGITPEHYDYLRKRTPNSTIRKKFSGAKKDAVYGVDIVGTPEPDHIVSVNEISQMEGFSRLTPEQQVEILNMEGNFMALDKRINSSKQDMTFSEWKGHPEFGEIDPAKRQALLAKETEARAAIQKRIGELDPLKQK